MSWLLTRFYDRLMQESELACLAQWRSELLASVEGNIVEIGAGTGANLTHYSSGVRRLFLCEPDVHMRQRLASRVESLPHLRCELLSTSASSLPLADAVCDAAVSTLVLCSVEDPASALGELWRVLRPGGSLLFIEHVQAPRGSPRRRWQNRIEPVWKRLAGNCHLTRDTASAIEAAGFETVSLERASIRKAMPVARPSIRGRAVKVARGVE